jgi:Tfp pilus assembly protein PilO
MKELMNKFISQIHWVVLGWTIFSVWTMYQEHLVQLDGIKNKGLTVDKEIEKTQKKVKQVEDFSKNTEVVKTRVEEVAKNIEAVQKQLPSDINDSQILTYFQTEMNSLNIKDSNFSPGKEEKGTYYISKDYKLKGKGTYLQFLIFLERIANADRIYNIKDLKFSSPTGNQKGRFQIINAEGTLQALKINPDFKVDRGF